MNSATRSPAGAGSSRLETGTSGVPSMSATLGLSSARHRRPMAPARWTVPVAASGSGDDCPGSSMGKSFVQLTLSGRHGVRLGLRVPCPVRRGRHENHPVGRCARLDGSCRGSSTDRQRRSRDSSRSGRGTGSGRSPLPDIPRCPSDCGGTGATAIIEAGSTTPSIGPVPPGTTRVGTGTTTDTMAARLEPGGRVPLRRSLLPVRRP